MALHIKDDGAGNKRILTDEEFQSEKTSETLVELAFAFSSYTKPIGIIAAIAMFIYMVFSMGEMNNTFEVVLYLFISILCAAVVGAAAFMFFIPFAALVVLGIIFTISDKIFFEPQKNLNISHAVVEKTSQNEVILNGLDAILDEQAKINQRDEAFTNELSVISERYEEWIKNNAAEYLIRTPIYSNQIMPNQLNDMGLATPQQQREILNLIDYRRKVAASNKELLQKYHPLSPSIEAFFNLGLIVSKRFSEDAKLLANGSITFGEFNKRRLYNFKSKEASEIEITNAFNLRANQLQADSKLLAAGSITFDEFKKRRLENVEIELLTDDAILKKF